MKTRTSIKARLLLTLAFSLLPSAFAAASSSQFHCRWNFTDFTVTPIGVKQVRIQTIAPYGTIYTNLITGDLRTFQAGTSGSLTVSNLANGRSYRVTFVGPTVNTVITNNFGTNVSGLVNAVDYLVAPLVVDGSTVAYSANSADALFHNVAGDTSTNAIFRGTFKIPDGATVGRVLTVTNADGSAAWQTASGGTGTLATNGSNFGTSMTALAVSNTATVTWTGYSNSGTGTLTAEVAANSIGGAQLTIDATAESEIEAAADLQDLQGGVTDGQVPNTITIDLATTATTANAGDSATAFFTAGQIERARGGTGADTSSYGTGLLGSDASNNTIDVDTEAELETALAGLNLLTLTEGNAAYQPLDADLTALAAIAGVQGDVIYHNGTSWVRLGAGTSGQYLQTQGTGANPQWANLTLAAGDTFNFFGKSSFHSNVTFTTTSYSTNAADSETVIDFRKNYRAFATNNNTAFSALAGIDASGTNFQSVNIFGTNTSGATKTITMSAAFQNMNASQGNTLYWTNVAHLLVFLYPGFGSNFYYNSR